MSLQAFLQLSSGMLAGMTTECLGPKPHSGRSLRVSPLLSQLRPFLLSPKISWRENTKSLLA
eukprot:966468-Pelagomonas_calceolata.AAC.1